MTETEVSSENLIESEKSNPQIPRTRHRWRNRIIVLIILFVGLLSLYLCRHQILIATARLLVVEDTLIASDYIVVLGGDSNSRPFLAAELFKKGLAPKVIIFENKSDRLTEAGLALREDEL